MGNKNHLCLMKILLIIVLSISILNLSSLINISVYAQTTQATSDTITTMMNDKDNKLLVESMKKVYEISPNAIISGYSAELFEKDAFKVLLNNKAYYFIFWNSTSDQVGIYLSSGKYGILKINETKVVDVNDDGKYDVILSLMTFDGKIANISIKQYSENNKRLGDYKELFDIELGLKEDKLTVSKDLTVFIKFINFGEGPSNIKIVYSITDLLGNEFYHGVDEKTVYTEESVIKNFDSLNLPVGKYKVLSKIYYGKNQTAESEKSFEVTGQNDSSSLSSILAIIFIIIIVTAGIFFIRKKMA